MAATVACDGPKHCIMPVMEIIRHEIFMVA